ncbi:MAG: hypothetical protein WA549_01895 [Thermoplasmata archaeon]
MKNEQIAIIIGAAIGAVATLALILYLAGTGSGSGNGGGCNCSSTCKNGTCQSGYTCQGGTCKANTTPQTIVASFNGSVGTFVLPCCNLSGAPNPMDIEGQGFSPNASVYLLSSSDNTTWYYNGHVKTPFYGPDGTANAFGGLSINQYNVFGLYNLCGNSNPMYYKLQDWTSKNYSNTCVITGDCNCNPGLC